MRASPLAAELPRIRPSPPPGSGPCSGWASAPGLLVPNREGTLPPAVTRSLEPPGAAGPEGRTECANPRACRRDPDSSAAVPRASCAAFARSLGPSGPQILPPQTESVAWTPSTSECRTAGRRRLANPHCILKNLYGNCEGPNVLSSVTLSAISSNDCP